MTLADDIRKATEGYEPRCVRTFPDGSACDDGPDGMLHRHIKDDEAICAEYGGHPRPECHPLQPDPNHALLVRALRVVEAADRVSKEAETDDDFEGLYTDWIIPDETMTALRAALRGDR